MFVVTQLDYFTFISGEHIIDGPTQSCRISLPLQILRFHNSPTDCIVVITKPNMSNGARYVGGWNVAINPSVIAVSQLVLTDIDDTQGQEEAFAHLSFG